MNMIKHPSQNGNRQNADGARAVSVDNSLYEVAIIGAGPIGLELAVCLKQAGVNTLHLDANQIGHTMTWWPRNTHFFSTTERLAIAGVPIQIAQSLMGHQSVEMTANIYTRVTTQNLRDALRVVPPLEGTKRDEDEADEQRACRSNS